MCSTVHSTSVRTWVPIRGLAVRLPARLPARDVLILMTNFFLWCVFWGLLHHPLEPHSTTHMRASCSNALGGFLLLLLIFSDNLLQELQISRIHTTASGTIDQYGKR